MLPARRPHRRADTASRALGSVQSALAIVASAVALLLASLAASAVISSASAQVVDPTTPVPMATPVPGPGQTPAPTPSQTPVPTPTPTPSPTPTPPPTVPLHKPAVATRSVTDAATTTATLVGRVNPYGLATKYFFEWGTSSKVYGQVTQSVEAVVGPTSTVTAQLAALSPNTRYVFRVVATNAAGTVRSSPRSFMTGRGLTGISLTAARRTLSWEGVTVVSGLVRGTVPGGARVRLLRQDHPFTSPYREVGSQSSSAGGAFSFSIARIYESVHLRVVADAAPVVESPTVTLDTRMLARLTMGARRAASVRLTGVVYPAVAATTVRLQRRSPSGRWATVSRPQLERSASGRAKFAVRVARSKARTLRYRLVVTPNDAGAHLTTTTTSVYVPRRR